MHFFDILLFISFTLIYYTHAQSGSVSCVPITLKVDKFDESRDGVEFNKMKVTDDAAKLIFTYKIPSNEDIYFEWYHNDEKLNIPKTETGHLFYEQNHEYSQIYLLFKKPTAKYSGEYNLTVLSKATGKTLTSTICKVETKLPLIDMSYDTIRETEGDVAKIECKSSSFPKPKKIKWSYWSNEWVDVKDATYESLPSTEKATLLIQNVTTAHEGFYKCTVADTFSSANRDSSVYVLRVRNPNGVYWPLIGIAIQVLILIITISIYEKKQYDKRKLDKSEDKKTLDEAAQPLMQTANDKNVRV